MTEKKLGMGTQKFLHLIVASQEVKIEASLDVLKNEPIL